MEKIQIATAQFENRSGDKAYNLSVIERISAKAAEKGAKAICFHECSVSGYTFARSLSRDSLLDLAEHIPDGPSTGKLLKISRKYRIAVLAGFFEKDRENHLYNAYLCVQPDGKVTKHRKIHPFINRELSPGNRYTVFDLNGWKAGILICYDNNIIENVRATVLSGADLIFMPHVTMCTPSPRPGSGYVDAALWKNRKKDPVSLALEFNGPKGREWLMKWLPARACDNGVYVVFSNPVGMDGDQLKNGCSMILDPHGDILKECKGFKDGFVLSTLDPAKLAQSGGYRYRQARKPELYGDILAAPNQGKQIVSWMD